MMFIGTRVSYDQRMSSMVNYTLRRESFTPTTPHVVLVHSMLRNRKVGTYMPEEVNSHSYDEYCGMKLHSKWCNIGYE